MANQNGGGPQVPFGDGNHVPLEDHRSDIGIVFKNIFTSCDTDDTGLVSASDLIIYVTPFLLENESEFTELKMLLDPKGTNPPYDSERFQDVMSQWTAQVRDDITMRQISSNIAIRETDNVHVSSSSHTNSVGDSLCRINENEVLTLSNTQSYSGSALDNSDTVDVQALHDQVKQLQYENRKVTGELKALKDQLLTSEEQTDMLHLDYEKLKKKFKVKERQLKDELQKYEKSSAEILETSTSAKKQVMKLEKIVASYEKEVFELKKNISDLESKKKKLEDNNKGVSANEIELKKIIFRLESEVNLKDQEVAVLEEQTANLHVQLEEHQESINHYMEINDCLKLEKSKIEKRFREHVSETIESRNSSINDASLNSPIQGILKKLTRCNPAIENYHCSCMTPPQAPLNPSTMQRRLSLNLNDVQKLFYIETKKSVDSDEGSVAFSNKLLKNSKFDEVFSTPIKRGLLLDASLPQAARNILPLSPLIVDKETHYIPDSPQQLNNNLHILSTSHVCTNEGKDRSNSLPTLFIIERSDPINAATVNDCQSNSQIVDSGSSDSDMFWKLQLLNQSKTNSDQSLQLELLKAEDKLEDELPNVSCYSVSKKDFELLESRIMEYERTIKELLLEVDRLKVSQRSSSDLVANHKKSRRGSLDSCLKLERSCVTLKNKIETLESDSNCKYIKIVDLMEEIEKLKQSIDQLKYVNAELEFEKETLQEKLKAFHNIQEDSARILTQLDGAKEAHEELQKNFENTLESERKISAEFVNVCCKNGDLEAELKELNQTVDQLELKNVEITSEILQLKEENSRLEYKIATTAEEQIESISTRNELNLRLTQMGNENNNLKENLSKTEKEYQNVVSKCQEVTKTKNQYMEQIKCLTLKSAESDNCIQNLNTEIENLKATNQNLVQDINTKKSQTEVLKQMIEYQNTDLEAVKTERDVILEKMYAFENENEKILKINKELSTEFKNSEKEKLLSKVKSLEELNQGSHLEIQSLLDEVKSVKDINNNILHQLDSLLAEKDNLIKSSEKLGYSIQILKEEKRLLEEKLTETEQQYRSTLKEHKMESKVKDDLNSKLVIEIEDKIKEITVLSKKQPCKTCCSLKEAIENHEMKISDLEKLNEIYKAEERHKRIASYDRLQIKIGRLEGKINDKDECLKQREGEIRDLELKNIELQMQFDASKSKEIELSNENCSLRDQLAQKSTLENKFRKNLEEIQKLQTELQDLRQLKVNLCDEYTTFKNKSKSMIEKKDTRLHANSTEIADLKKEIERLQKKNADLDKSLEKEKKATIKTKSLKDNLDLAKKENVQLKLDLKELSNRCDSLDKKNYSLESIDREYSTKIADLNKEIERLQKKNADLDKSLEKEKKATSETKLLKDNLDSAKKENDQLKLKLEELNNRYDSLDKKNDSLERIGRENSTAITDLNKEIEGLQKKNADLDKSLEKEKKATIKTKSLKDNLDSAKKENNQLKLKLEELNNRYDSLDKKNYSLESIGREYSTKIADLNKEIERLQKKNADLDKSLEKSKTASLIEIEKEKKATGETKLLKDNLDSTKKENVQLKLDLEELNKSYGSLDKKNNDSLERIDRENSSLKQQINECRGIISDLEKKHEKAQHDLQKSEAKNLSIRKTLTDVQSNICEEVEDVMVKSMEMKNLEEMVKKKSDEVISLQDELETCQKELAQVKAHLLEVNKSFGDLSDYLQVVKERMEEKRQRLSRSTLTMYNSWRLKLESIPENRRLLQDLDRGESLNPTETFTGALDEEIYRLKSQIRVTCLFLDLIGSLKSGYHNVETQASPPVDQKTIKKYTQNENNKGTETAEYFYSEKSLQTPDNISSVKSQGCMTSCTSRDQSPDTGGLHIIDQYGDTLSSEESVTNIVCDTNEEKCKDIALLKIASPKFSDILEQIELVKDNSTEWTPLELEEKFTTLHAAFSTDCGTVEERYQNQQSVRCRVEEKFAMETEKLVTTLISIKKLGREQELDDLVDKCLRQVEHVVCTFSQASVSAMQYGALYHEQKIVMGVNFMILHSVYLHDTTEHSVRQLKSINTLITEGNENLVEALHSANILEVEQSKEITSNAESDLDEEKYDDFSTKINPSSKRTRNSWWWIFACLLLILFVLFYAITENSVTDWNSYGYPLSWLSWYDIRSVFQLNYLNGPPPI